MKRILLLITIVSSIVISNSCVPDTMLFGDAVYYGISFIFQDIEGNNLAEGIDLEDWIPANGPKEQATSGVVVDYKLDIILSKPINEDDHDHGLYGHDQIETILMYNNINDKLLLTNHFRVHTNCVEPQDKVTYHLTCPHIFGDNETHVITTYWKEDLGEKITSTYYPECYKVEFDGKEITDISYDFKDEYKTNYVTLTVNR